VSRVIAGVVGGRRLVMPAGESTRPTSERTREGLYSTLTSLCGPLEGMSFLDLYAGSGAVGLEAASRGAARVLMVERDPKALRALRTNIDTLRLDGVEMRGEPVERVLANPGTAPFDIVFIDPPYADPVDAVLDCIVDGNWLAASAVVVVERASRGAALAWPAGIEPLRSRRYGEGTLWYGRRS
jgi:16S rRNA (guanine966-N2)-methyltransferase